MPQEGRSGKSLANDDFQPASHLAASLAPAPPWRLTSELQHGVCNPGRKTLFLLYDERPQNRIMFLHWSFN